MTKLGAILAESEPTRFHSLRHTKVAYPPDFSVKGISVPSLSLDALRLHQRSRGVTVSTEDSDSSSLGSNPNETLSFVFCLDRHGTHNTLLHCFVPILRTSWSLATRSLTMQLSWRMRSWYAHRLRLPIDADSLAFAALWHDN